MFAEGGSTNAARNHSSSFISHRYPNRIQWQMLSKLQSNLMELEDFVSRWKVSHKELAKICCCSPDTVDRWFIRTAKRREPTLHHKLRLGITNKLWTDLVNRQENN